MTHTKREAYLDADGILHVDGVIDPNGLVEYFGVAKHVRDDLYVCFAHVDGHGLCVVECQATMLGPLS